MSTMRIVDVQTGVVTEREMTAEEIAIVQAMEALK